MSNDSDVMSSRLRFSNPARKLTQRIAVPVTDDLHDTLAAIDQ